MGTKSSNATSGALVKIFSDPAKLGVTERNARYLAQCLRDSGVISGEGAVGSGVRLTTAEAVSWLIGQVMASSLPKAAETIKRYRNAPDHLALYTDGGQHRSPEDNARAVLSFTRGLSCAVARTFGKAVDSIVDDMRSGAFDTWKENVPHRLTLEFHDSGYAQIYLDRPHFNKAVVLGFGKDNRGRGVVSRVTRIDGSILEDIASALGPRG